MDKHLYKRILKAQADEITEYHIYSRLAAKEIDGFYRSDVVWVLHYTNQV